MRRKKLKRVSKDMRTIEEANAGDYRAFAKVLDLAYGRKGKMKWELMEPFLSAPGEAIPERILNHEESSRPPVFSPELKALLTSDMSRTTKPLAKASLDKPPILPARSDPNSEDAKMYAPFSKRREVNMRWRYYVREWKKVFPPLQARSPTGDTSELVDYPIFNDIERLAGREQDTLESNPEVHSTTGALPTRWLRRRYQELLGRAPTLQKTDNGKDFTPFMTKLSPVAISPYLKYSSSNLKDATGDDLLWLDHGQVVKKGGCKSKIRV